MRFIITGRAASDEAKAGEETTFDEAPTWSASAWH
jgi:hypothetical protein